MLPTTDPGLDSTLLATKVYRPQKDEGHVSRARLFDRLDAGVRGPLTLVSAPTGFGKTTVVADWLASRWEGPSAWVSLDEGDNDPSLFWAYVGAALDNCGTPVSTDLLPLLFSPQPPPVDAVVGRLIRALDGLEHDVVLTLDDFHDIHRPEVHEAVATLVERAPERLHIIIVSRMGLPFAVGRLRARGRLLEVEVDDLRFDAGEAAAFLESRIGAPVSMGTAEGLAARTEGWIAGLQLASLSVRDPSDAHAVASMFTGDHPHVAEFLVEEVLDRQDPEVRSFLLRTSILDRFRAELCDAVTGEGGGAAHLRELRRRQLFLVDLDAEGKWYRYHHLFGEMLRARLARSGSASSGSASVEALHRRASAWFAEEGLLEEAVHHALLAADPEWAADVVERGWRSMDRRFRSGTWLAWAEALPRSEVWRRPVLSMGLGWALLDVGRIDEAEPFVERAARWVDASDEAPAHRVAAPRDFEALPGTLASARAYLAHARGDLEGTEAHARRALELIPEDDPFYRGIPAVTVGLAHWARGELDSAFQRFLEGLEAFRLAGNPAFVHSALYVLGDIRLEQGVLSEARRFLDDAVPLDSDDADRGEEVYFALADILLEQGRIEEAGALLGEVRPVADGGGDARASAAPDARGAAARAGLTAARGDLMGAVSRLDGVLSQRLDADRIARRRPLEAQRARWLAMAGRFEEAEQWAAKLPDVLHPNERHALADLRLRRLEAGDGEVEVEEVAALVHACQSDAEADSGPRRRVQAALLQARLLARGGDAEGASRVVAEALDHAAVEGLVATVRDAAGPLGDLLRSLIASEPRWSGLRDAVPSSPGGSAPDHPLQALLTRREFEILHLIRRGLRNKEIAAQLFISPSTVKRHVANIYAKMGVTHRTAAVAQFERMEGV